MKNKIAAIEVIGSGCANCKKLFDLAVVAAKELGIEAEVEYSDDIQKGLAMGVLQFPVLAVNGRPALTGAGDMKKIKEVLIKEGQNNEPSGCCPCGGDCGCA